MNLFSEKKKKRKVIFRVAILKQKQQKAVLRASPGCKYLQI